MEVPHFGALNFRCLLVVRDIKQPFVRLVIESDISGPLRRLTASKEIILSAGTINTPQILLNSGIGNPKDLRAVGIKPLVDLPDVGENLSDHVLLGTPWLVNSNDTFDDFSRDLTIQEADIDTWRTTRQGFLVDTVSSHLGFLRLPKTHSAFQTISDPSAGPKSPHYELLVSVSIFYNDSVNTNTDQ